MSACKEHAKNPVKGYSPCAGCEIESLRAQLEREKGERERFEGSYKRLLAAVNSGPSWSEALDRAEQAESALAAALEEVERLKTTEPGKLIAEIELDYAKKTNNLIERHANQISAAQLHAEGQYRAGMLRAAEIADWHAGLNPSTFDEYDTGRGYVEAAKDIATAIRTKTSKPDPCEGCTSSPMDCKGAAECEKIRAAAKTAGATAPYQFADEAHRQRCEDFDRYLTKRDPDLDQTAGEEGE